MEVGAKLREPRVAKNLSQATLRTGQVFAVATRPALKAAISSSRGSRGKELGAFQKLAKALSKMDERDRMLLLSMAQGMARRGGKR